RGNQVHGLLTHAVIDALEHAPTDSAGVVTTDHIANYIRGRWTAICNGVPADPPEFAYPTMGPINFVRRSAGLISQRVIVAGWNAGESVELRDGTLAVAAQFVISADRATVTAVWSSRGTDLLPVTKGAITISLAGGLYQLRRANAQQI